MRIIALVLAVLLVACGGGPTAPIPALPAGQSAKPPAQPAPAKPSFPGAPATATGDALAWVLDAIVKRQGKVERAELEAHFDASFLAKVPVEQAQKIFGEMSQQLADLALVDARSDDEQLVARATARGIKL